MISGILRFSCGFLVGSALIHPFTVMTHANWTAFTAAVVVSILYLVDTFRK